MSRPTRVDLRWAPERFFWAVLDAGELGRSPGDRELGYLFETVMPTAEIEQIHAVYSKVPGTGQYLACGLRRETLAAINGSTVTLSPERLPAFVECDVDPRSLNLLSGEFAPRPVRRCRRLMHVMIVLVLLACSTFAIIGLERRRAALHVGSSAVRELERTVYAATLGQGAVFGNPALPAERQLTALLRQLERTRRTLPAEMAPGDATGDLEALLAAWPLDAAVRTTRLSVGESSIAVTATAASMDDAQRLATALSHTRGWRLSQPSYSSSNNGVTVGLMFEPETSTGDTP